MKLLSNRLETILNMIPLSFCIADIGADHGLVSREIIKRNIAERVFAVENKIGPFKRLEKEVNSSLLTSRITLSLSSGISKLPSDVDTVVIAGMGGKLIAKILVDDKDKLENVNYLLVDGHSDLEYLRSSITKLGFKIEKEQILEEDEVFYEIILFSKGECNYSDDELRFGPFLKEEKSSIFLKKWTKQVKKYQLLLEDEKVSNERKIILKSEIERISNYL